MDRGGQQTLTCGGQAVGGGIGLGGVRTEVMRPWGMPGLFLWEQQKSPGWFLTPTGGGFSPVWNTHTEVRADGIIATKSPRWCRGWIPMFVGIILPVPNLNHTHRVYIAEQLREGAACVSA